MLVVLIVVQKCNPGIVAGDDINDTVGLTANECRSFRKCTVRRIFSGHLKGNSSNYQRQKMLWIGGHRLFSTTANAVPSSIAVTTYKHPPKTRSSSHKTISTATKNMQLQSQPYQHSGHNHNNSNNNKTTTTNLLQQRRQRQQQQ